MAQRPIVTLDTTGETLDVPQAGDTYLMETDLAITGNVELNGNITNLADITFKTGAVGGTVRTGTSAADKFQLQAYDVNGAAYTTVLEADAGNTPRLQIPVDYLDLEDATDQTKIARLSSASITTGTTRTYTLPDVNGTFAMSDNIEGTAIKSTGEAGGTKFLREDGDNSSSWQHLTEERGVSFSDETTALTVGTAKATFHMPNYATTLLEVSVGVTTAPVGSTAIFDLNEDGVSVLSTKVSIDAGEKISETAATPPVISDSALAANALMTVDVDQVGSVTAGTGGKLYIKYRRSA